MKLFLSAIFFISVGILSAQQKSFLYYDEGDPQFFIGYSAYSLAELFQDPGKYESLSISPEDLDKDSSYDYSKLINLQVIEISFSFDPESSDAAKKVFRDKTKKQLEKLALFSKCPHLKRIAFKIGEQIYMDSEQCKPRGIEKKDYSLQYKRMSRENLEGAWENFGKDLLNEMPGVKLYADTWGW